MRIAIIGTGIAGNVVAYQLRDKYAAPGGPTGFEDKTLLQVMLRNVTVRKDKGVSLG